MTSRQEQETIINWNEEEEIVSVYTASSITARKCQKLGFKLIKTDKVAKTGDESWWFECGKKNISMRKALVISTARRDDLSRRAKERVKSGQRVGQKQ